MKVLAAVILAAVVALTVIPAPELDADQGGMVLVDFGNG